MTASKKNPSVAKPAAPKTTAPVVDKKAQAAADKAKMIATAKAMADAAPKTAPATPAKPEAAAPKGKTERKAAEAKPAGDKTVTKPAAPVVAFAARTVKPGTPVFVIAEDARPVSGRNLFAHTHAALTLLGLLDASLPAVPEAAVLTVMGQRAVSYHKKQMNFESAPNHGLRLTVAGRNNFVNRFKEGKVASDLANAFMALFVDGKAESKTGVSQGKVYKTVLAA